MRTREQNINPAFGKFAPAYQDGNITMIVGSDFTEPETWGQGVRFLLVSPPPRHNDKRAITRADCVSWVKQFAPALGAGLEKQPLYPLYRMISVLEGSIERGWYGTILLDLPKRYSANRLKAIWDNSEAPWLLA